MSEHDGAASLVRSDALLACPHCGRQPTEDMGGFVGEGKAYVASIECECGAGMLVYQWWPNGLKGGPVPPRRVDALCRKRWNRRHANAEAHGRAVARTVQPLVGNSSKEV